MGEWQIAFWAMTGVCFTGMVYIGKSVINNDKSMREEYKEEDKEIIKRIEHRLESIENKIDDHDRKLTQILTVLKQKDSYEQ